MKKLLVIFLLTFLTFSFFNSCTRAVGLNGYPPPFSKTDDIYIPIKSILIIQIEAIKMVKNVCEGIDNEVKNVLKTLPPFCRQAKRQKKQSQI